jgi:hypothetical protein
MLPLLLIISRPNPLRLVDGIENVNCILREENTIEFVPKNEKIAIFFLKLKDLIIHMESANTSKKNRLAANNVGMTIPNNSKIIATANWNLHEGYIMGFIDATDCERITFINDPVKVGKKPCLYDISKYTESEEKSVEKSVSFNRKSGRRVIQNYYDDPYYEDVECPITEKEIEELNGIDYNNDTTVHFALSGIISMPIGYIAYVMIYLLFRTTCCYTCCKCCNLYHIFNPDSEYFFNPNNDFYTKTLEEFEKEISSSSSSSKSSDK